jgi:hypothetical protein
MKAIKRIWGLLARFFLREWFLCCALPVTVFGAFLFWPELRNMDSEQVANWSQLLYATATAVFAGAAWAGINTWRQQLHFKLAKKLLVQAYKVERIINDIRSPWGSPDEKNVLQMRFAEIGSTFDALCFEGKAVWDDNFYALRKPFVDCTNELSIAKATLHDAEQRAPIPADDVRQARNIVWRTSFDKHDEFSGKVNAAVVALAEYLKPHLKN